LKLVKVHGQTLMIQQVKPAWYLLLPGIAAAARSILDRSLGGEDV
jgi:hypothetical protein